MQGSCTVTTPSHSNNRWVSWLKALMCFMLITMLKTVPADSATFNIGAADGSFESGLGGMTPSGDVSLVSNLGILQATGGTQALLMTTTPDDGSTPADADSSTLLIESFEIGAEYATLRLDYNFLTDEPRPSFTNDAFTVRLVLVTAGGEEHLLSVDTFTEFFPAPWTGYDGQSGFRTLVADVSAHAGSGDLVSLELRIDDIGDGRRNSAALVDNLRLVEPGFPTAVSNISYIEVDPAETIAFDARESSDDSAIAGYEWDFANGYLGFGAQIPFSYAASGVYQGTLTVTDDEGQSDTAHFTVVVGSINHPPVIVSTPNVAAAEKVPYHYQVRVENPEAVLGDFITYALTVAPPDMTIDPATGLISWTPPAGTPLVSDVTVEATDSMGLSDTQSYRIALGPEVYIAAIRDDGWIYTARSLGDGTFDDFKSVEDIGGNSRGIVIADFNDDNDLDIITGYGSNPRSHLFYYEREGNGFQTPVYIGTVGDSSTSAGGWTEDIAAEDFNNDGRMDFIANGDSANAWYFQNTGPLTTEPENFFSSDFETGNEGWGGQQCRTSFERTDATSFSGDWSVRMFATGSPSCMSIDINPSGWFMSRGSSMSFAYRIPPGVPVGLLFNVNGKGWIYLGGSPAADGGIYDFTDVPKVNLIDDDTWRTVTVDIYQAIKSHWPNASYIDEFEWWTDDNATTGQEFWFDDFRITRPRMISGFDVSLLPNTGGNSRGTDAADVDNDGNMDFARARYSSGYVHLYKGDGSGNFTTSQVADPGVDPYGVLLADFDNDGITDLMANYGSNGDPRFYKGNGNGTFQDAVYIPSLDTNRHSSYGAFDFNNDGNQDVVAADYNGRQLWHYPGNGDATFGPRSLIGNTGNTTLSITAPAGWCIGQPYATATQDAASIDEGGTVNFDASASYDNGTIVSYEWDFGDGNAAAGITAANTFAAEGMHTVVLTVTDDDGLQDRFAMQVRVTGQPPTSDPDGPYSFDEPHASHNRWAVRFDGSGSSDPETSIKHYEWDFDDSDGVGIDATGATPIHVYSATGDYTVTLTVYDQVGQSHTATTTVSLTPGDLPVADIIGPITLDETDASLGGWLGRFNISVSSDTEGLAAWSIDWGDGQTSSWSVVKDNFADGELAVNPTWTAGSGNWFIDNAQLRQTDTTADWRWLQDLTRSYTDFQLEVDFKGDPSPNGGGYMGIVFRNANTSGNRTSFLMYSRDNYGFWRFYDWQTDTVLADGGSGWDPDTWYHLRLVVVGNTMKLYVTPEGGTEDLAVETTNPAHRSGGIGLLAHGLSLTYDNLLVTPLGHELTASHSYAAVGTYTAELTVIDHAGQTDTATVDTQVTAGDPPAADTGGPYVLDESTAEGVRWNLVLNVGASSDDTNVQRYIVDFGDGTTYTSGISSGGRSGYFISGTDLYGYDVPEATIQRVIGLEDNTSVELINLATGQVIGSTTLNRFGTWNNLRPGDGVPFKIKASKPVVAYLTDLQSHSAFLPSLDDSPVGREFVFFYDNEPNYWYFAYDEAHVQIFDTNNNLVTQLLIPAGEYRRVSNLPANNRVYRIVTTGRIAVQADGINSYTTVPAASGAAVGREFRFAATAWATGAFAVFAYQPANVEVFDMDTGASLYTQPLATGEMYFQNGVGTRRLRLVSSGDVEVWAGDTEGGTGINNLGDDISVTTGKAGTEFYLHNLADGIVIFAPDDDTVIDVDSGGITQTLGRDEFLRLAPADFPSGSGVHHIIASKPVLIQTLGRANAYNDLGTYLGGFSMRHQYTTTGTYTLSVTAVDNAGQTDTATTTVQVQVNDPPVPDIAAPDIAGESYATGGQWSVQFDASGSSDDFGIFKYEWDFGDGGTSSEIKPTHIYNAPGTYTVTLTVTDHAGQQVQTSHTIEVTFGDGPTADAGGPYTFGEESASFGVWTATLDGSGSTDDNGIYDYTWKIELFELDDFEDGVVSQRHWSSAGSSESDGRLKILGASNWGNRGFYSRETFQRRDATEFTGQVLDPDTAGNHHMMWGVFKNNPSSFNHNQMHHAIYFDNGTLRIYEDGSHRGDVGTYQRNVLYDAKIVVKSVGADYFIREAGTTDWTQLTSYKSYNRSGSPLRIGASVYSGQFEFDLPTIDPLVLMGPVATREFFKPAQYQVTLTVRDHALQADSDSTAITIEDGDLPEADAGGDLTAEVGSMVQFNGTGSTDDNAIQQYHWVFGDTTGGPADLPYTGRGATPQHFYRETGTYDVTLTVIDNTLKSDSDTTTVEVIVGDPPVANAGGPYQGGAFGPPVYFDGRGSSDDFGIVEYRWDFNADVDSDGDGNFTNDIDAVGARPFHVIEGTGTFLNETFDGTTLNSTNWLAGGATQDDVVSISGAGSWGNRYLFSLRNFPRAALSYRGRIRPVNTSGNQHGMWGLKNTGTNYSYNQMPHAIYFRNGAVQIYENGSYRGQFGSYTRGNWYEVRIDVKSGSGATYYYREEWAADWTQLYDSTNDSNSLLKLGATISTGTFEFDNFKVLGKDAHVVTLTVEDGAGQTASDTTTVTAPTNLPPHVITVPWVAHDPIAPHETYNGKQIHLKGIVRDADPVSFQWDFGDGTQSAVQTVTNTYDLSVTHTYPEAPAGTPFVAVLKVWDSAGQMGQDTYNVVVKNKNLTAEINIAIDEGLWYLHRRQTRTTTGGYPSGWWKTYAHGNYYASATSSAIQSFEINGHLENGDPGNNPYVETVDRGLKYLFSLLRTYDIGSQTYGEPDTNGNALGLSVNSRFPIYEGGPVMDAIASSRSPLKRTVTGADNINRRRYFDILTDMTDQFAWGQTDYSGSGGGWRYSWNSSIDNSAAQWGAIGMQAAQDIFGIPVPQWVKERNEVWLNYSYDGTGFGYSGRGNGRATTPSGLVQVAFDDKDINDTRWETAENYIANVWSETNSSSIIYRWSTSYGETRDYYAMYAFTKAMRLANPEPVITLGSTGLDWFDDPDLGLARMLISDQLADGSFSGQYRARWDMRAAWAVIMLSRTLFVQPPVADAGRDRVWAVDLPFNFDGSGSYHLDPFRDIVKYEWDFESDGVFDSASSDPFAAHTFSSTEYPETTLPQTVTATLRVTDNNVPPLTAVDTVELIIAIPPHPPVADAGGPYTCTAGLPCGLDGSGSFDIDPTDFIARYEWELDGMYPFDFDEAGGRYDEAGASQPSYIWDTPGTYNVGLRVWDNGVLNDLDDDGELDENERLSDQAFTIATVVENLAPVADANGPYTIDEGTALILDGSGSYDPNGDPLSFAWDLDNDGEFDDATVAKPSYTWMDNGTYTVGLKVSDGLLEDTAKATVIVNDLGPTAAFTWSPEPQAEGAAVNFTDQSTSPVDPIVSWAWNFGGLGSSSDQHPSFTFNDNGIYTVTLTVTDEDGSTDSVSHDVTVSDRGPAAAFTWSPEPQNEGAAVNFTDQSTSPVDSIVSWAWNFGGLGSSSDQHPSFTFNDNGIYTVTLTVTDDDGSIAAVSHEVTILDQAPTANLTGDPSLDEEQTGSYDAGGSTSSPDVIVLYEWDLDGDGQFDDATGATADYAWPNAGSYTVAVRVTDDDGSTDTATLDVTVNPGGQVLTQCIFDLTARPKSGKVQTVWTHESDAECYDVYRSTSLDVELVPGNRIADCHVTTYATYLDLDVVDYTTYYYKVVKVAGGSRVCYSNEASATPVPRTRTR
jgi:PKD repeat protein